MKIETPKPPSQLFYKFYFIIGLLKYPKRLWNFIKYKTNKNPDVVNYKPIFMDIEPTQRCNFKCIMCVNPHFKDKRKDMSIERFKKIVDEQTGLLEVKIVGVGEPLLNKDFFQMIEYSRKKHLWVRTTINGSLLQQNDSYKKLIDLKVHDLNISIDGATKDVYESIRLGSDFDRLVENCKLLNEYNQKKGKTTIRAWVVIQKENEHQLYEFPKLFKDLGFEEMSYSFAMHNYGRDGKNSEYSDVGVTKEEFHKLSDICKNLDIKLTFFYHPRVRIKQNKFCKIPFNKIYVTTDGYMLPCCYIANQEVANLGKYENFSDIWFKKYIPFRKSLRVTKKVPNYCKQCHGEDE